MITKEQAMALQHGDILLQVRMAVKQGTYFDNGQLVTRYDLQKSVHLDRPNRWRVSGKIKTWKTRPDEFKLPIKYGLYENSYLTQENAHLFEILE